MAHKQSPFASFNNFAIRVPDGGGSVSNMRSIGVAIFTVMVFTLGGNAIAADDGWSVASRSPEVVVYERTHKGSALQEFKAVGVLDASPEVLKRVIDDVAEYPHFMPYVTEARVISGDAANRVSYQRISPPMVSDLDYTVRVNCETRSTPAGKSFCNRWQTANELGPAEKSGVRRVKITEGSWLLEPEDGGKKTRATYRIFSDTGGSLPAFIMNTASRTAIPKLFKSVQKQAMLPKYQHP
jgi:ribosome-associated toxin RatA of RatAB toxin-antitoxin module